MKVLLVITSYDTLGDSGKKSDRRQVGKPAAGSHHRQRGNLLVEAGNISGCLGA